MEWPKAINTHSGLGGEVKTTQAIAGSGFPKKIQGAAAGGGGDAKAAINGCSRKGPVEECFGGPMQVWTGGWQLWAASGVFR